MKKNVQSGFSLIELLIVVTIVGIIAGIAVPQFLKGIRAADNGAIFATLRTMSSAQLTYFTQRGRFARLDELNAMNGANYGTPSGTSLIRGRFVIQMSPATPTDAELRNGYTIVATGAVGGGATPYIYEVTQSGTIVQVAP